MRTLLAQFLIWTALFGLFGFENVVRSVTGILCQSTVSIDKKESKVTYTAGTRN